MALRPGNCKKVTVTRPAQLVARVCACLWEHDLLFASGETLASR